MKGTILITKFDRWTFQQGYGTVLKCWVGSVKQHVKSYWEKNATLEMSKNLTLKGL